MTWVKLDDHFDEHPKLAEVGPLGIALWTVGLAYCNRNLTDGFIPWATARKLLSWDFLGTPNDGGRRRRYTIATTSGMVGEDIDSDFVIELLVSAGLWTELDDGRYYIHDYDKYQPSKAEVLAEREKTRERQQRFRNGKRNAVTNADGNGVTNEPVTLPPVPVPVPNDLSVSNAAESIRLTPEQEELRVYLHVEVGRQVLKGTNAPDSDWCIDLIQRGLTRSDVDYAIQGAIANVPTLPYTRKILLRRVEERENGIDHDQLARDRAENAARGNDRRADGRARGVVGVRQSAESLAGFGDAPAGSIRADADHAETATGDPGAGAPIRFPGRDRASGGAR